MNKRGRFGHHPAPAIDFCVEVDEIAGLVHDAKMKLVDAREVDRRIFRAMMFRVGGDQYAVAAKAALRELERAHGTRY